MDEPIPTRDVPMEDTVENESYNQSPGSDGPPQAPPVDTMTNRFGMMLLESVQESHERMGALVKTLMTQHSAAHAQLWFASIISTSLVRN